MAPPRWVRPVLALLLAAAGALLLAYTGLTIRLGAHPKWAMSTATIGAIFGLLSTLGLSAVRIRRRLSVSVAGLVVLLCGAAAHFGKEAFVASYAENRLAGHLWYFGWIGSIAGATALVALVLWRGRRS